MDFESESQHKYCVSKSETFPKLTKNVLGLVTLFANKHPCEMRFSSLFYIKTNSEMSV